MAKKTHYLNNPNLPAVGSMFEYTPEMVKEMQKCANDVLYFAENYFYIINLDEGKQKIKLHKYQKKAIKLMKENRFSILLFARQSGKSTISTILCLWQAIFNENQNILIVANKESTAKQIFKRIRVAYEGLPNWLKSPTETYGKESLELENGSQIGISTTTGTAARGSSCNLLMIDEADWIDPGMLNEFWASVYPIISSSKKSKIVMCSTPRDTSGLFYKIYAGAVKDENNWAHMKVTWDQVPGRDEKWKKETMSSMSDPTAFDREFACSFNESGESSIDIDLFERMKMHCTKPEILVDGDHYSIWEVPQADHLYVAGVDISEGINQDASCIQILDITDLREIKQVACYHSNTITPIEFTPKLHEILLNWGKPLALIERNNCGAGVVDNLRKDYNYENIVSYGASIIIRDKVRLGIISHINVKYQAIINERYWINTVKSVIIKDVRTLNELKTFNRNANGSWSAESGKHDDRVMSLIWALFILSEPMVEKYFEVIQRDDNNKPLRIKQLDYGLKYFINPTSIYSNQQNSLTQGHALPFLLGNSESNKDADDLKDDGWTFLQSGY